MAHGHSSGDFTSRAANLGALPSITRREFAARTAATGAAVLGFPAVLSARSPNEKLNVVLIGCGGRGAGKSHIASYDLCKRARAGRHYMLVAPNYKTLMQSDLQTFLGTVRRLGLLRRWHKGDMFAELTGGATVFVRSGHEPENLAVAASVAKAYTGPEAFQAVSQMVQYHGGIGYTWEHDAHLFYKRAKTNETLLGSTESHLDRIAAHILDNEEAEVAS